MPGLLLGSRDRIARWGEWCRAEAARVLAALLAAAVLGACAAGDPPTVTPAPATPAGATRLEIPVQPPPGAAQRTLPAALPPVFIGALVTYVDAAGRFSMEVPAGWAETRQPPGRPGSHVVLGTVFQPPQANALITVTQFDSGRRPVAVGSTANEVLTMTGVMDLPGYIEIGREQVIERPGEALRVEMAYTTSDGVPMHSLVLFQIDDTTFSMVNVGVEARSWKDNQGAVRGLLRSYRVPAAPQG